MGPRSVVNRGRERFYPFTVLRFSIGYTYYYLSKGFLILLVLPLVMVLAPFPRWRHRVFQRLTLVYTATLSRWVLPRLGVYRIREITGPPPDPEVRPAIYVANHRGRMDGPLLLGLLPRTGVLIKAREGRQWSFSLLMRHFDFVGVDAQRLSTVATALRRCQELMGAGNNLLVFPEGTRARSGRLRRFGPTAFKLAVVTGRPIVPVVVHSTLPFMSHRRGSYFPRSENVIRVRFLDPEFPRREDSAQDLSDRVYRRMSRELKALDAGTVWEQSRP